MKSPEFITESSIKLGVEAENELLRFIKWGLADEDDRLRYRAAFRLNNRPDSRIVDQRGIRDYKALRGLGISMQGLESMHLDNELNLQPYR